MFNMFDDAYKLRNYDALLNYGKILIERAPLSMQNLYVYMGTAYTTKINQATSLPVKNAYVDSLMWVYDKRIEAFGDDATRGRAYILPRKAADYLNFRPADRETIRRYYLEAIEASGEQDPTLINTYFSVLADDYRADMIETDVLLGEFEKWNAVLENGTPEMKGAVATLEGLLLSSGAATCENLEAIYMPQYEADPNNVELMQKIVTRMSRGECDSEFRLTVAENLYKVQPDPQTGVALAAIFSQRKDYERALYYWEQSIAAETDPETKISYTLNAAASAIALTNYRQAADFARQVIAMDPENGLAYMILGQAQASAIPSNCSDQFTQKAAYWIVVDNLQRARTLLADDAGQVAALNEQINSSSRNFPTNDEAFFNGINSGDGYTVNCGWISGRTTVRVR
jgi:tetratricopeptide (TPR) repeat protein